MKNNMKNLIQNSVTRLQKMGSGKKSALVIAVLLIITSPLLAADYGRNSSVITISSWDNKPFVIEVNQQRYNSNGTITLKDIRPGKVRVRMFRENRSNGYNSCGNDSGRGSVMYNGFLDVPSRSRVNAEVNRNRRMRVIDVRRLGNRPNGNRPSAQNHGSHGSGGHGSIDVSPYEESHGIDPYGYEQTGGYGGACAMEMNEFDMLLREIDLACFSSDKLRVAKQALRHNYITSLQLEELIEAMDFDREQLAVAKAGYEMVLDKENIWKVYDAFSFSSTSREFERFVCGS